MQLVKVESGDGHVGRRVLQTQTSEVLKEKQWHLSDTVAIENVVKIFLFGLPSDKLSIRSTTVASNNSICVHFSYLSFFKNIYHRFLMRIKNASKLVNFH